MKKYFLFALVICLIFSIYSVSALYEGTINVGVGEDVEVTIGEPPSFTVGEGEECTTGQTTCIGTNHYSCIGNIWVNNGNVNGQCGYTTPSTGGGDTGGSSGGGGGGGGGSSKKLSDDNESDEEFLPLTNQELNEDDENRENEKSSFADFLTGAVTGVGNFVKSGNGVYAIIGGITFIVLSIAILFSRKKKPVELKTENSEEKKDENKDDKKI